MKKIAYHTGFKYQLAETYTIQVPILGVECNTEYINLDNNGMLTINKGYAWDGASGPTIDTNASMRGALIHDALYQLMRQEQLPQSYRSKADQIFHDICTSDGMWTWRADLWKFMVEKLASPAALPRNDKKIYYAP